MPTTETDPETIEPRDEDGEDEGTSNDIPGAEDGSAFERVIRRLRAFGHALDAESDDGTSPALVEQGVAAVDAFLQFADDLAFEAPGLTKLSDVRRAFSAGVVPAIDLAELVRTWVPGQLDEEQILELADCIFLWGELVAVMDGASPHWFFDEAEESTDEQFEPEATDEPE